MDDDGAVQHPVAVRQRRSDHHDGQQLLGPRDQLGQGRLDGVQEDVLQEQVLRGVAGQAQLGEHRDRDGVVMALADLRQHRPGVGRRLGQLDRQRAGRHPSEAVRVGGVEVHPASLGSRER
jgi:hypothetical protein